MNNATVNALIALFVVAPLAMADDFLTLAIKVTESGTFADTKTVGEAFDYIMANGLVTAEELAANEAKSLEIWEAKEATRKAARTYAYKYESTAYEAAAIGRNGN